MDFFSKFSQGEKINFIILMIILVFIGHIYWSNQKVETMSNVSVKDEMKNEVKEAVNKQYQADIEAIRNLSNLAKKLTEDGLITPGKLTLKDAIIIDHNVSHPDFKDGAIYRADSQLTIAADDLIRFRSSTKKANTIEMNVNDGTIKSEGGLIVKGRDILAELDRLNAKFPNPDTLDLVNGRIVARGEYFHMTGPGQVGSLRVAARDLFNWNGW